MASILVVCTGNICRSPLAEGFLRDRLAERLGEGAPSISSAGTHGWEGSPAVPQSVDVAAERGTDIAGHVAHRLESEHIEGADLVIGMTAEHRDDVVALVPEAVGKTFTLKELVRLAEALGPVEGGADLAQRVAAADELRQSGFAGNPADEDVVDPLGMPYETFRAVGWEIDEYCARLVDALYAGAPAAAEEAS